MEDSEIIIPNIINGFDFSLSFFSENFLNKDLSLSLSLLIRFENGLFTLKSKFSKFLIHRFK